MTEPTGEPTIMAETPPATTQVDWKESIPTEYRESVSKFNDVGTMAKSYVEMERMMGSRVKIPDENTPAEERSAFYQKLGRPQNPEAYDLGLAEDTPISPEIVSAVQKVAFENGVSQTQLQSIVHGYMEAEQAQLNQTYQQGEQQLQELWKENYEAEVKIGQRAIKELSDESYRDDLVEEGDYKPKYPNSPSMYKDDDTPEGAKARAWHEARGYTY
jgi:hypothetical protein